MHVKIKMAGQDLNNKDVGRRCGVKNLEYRLRKIRLSCFGHVKCRDENSILIRRALELG